MAINQLPDTPWHIGFVKKDEKDPRRHKARCFYNKDGLCTHFNMDKCYGSAHCRFYAESKKAAKKYIREMTIHLPLAGKIQKSLAYKPSEKESTTITKPIETYNSKGGKPSFILKKQENKPAKKNKKSRSVGICKYCFYFNKLKGICTFTKTNRGYIRNCLLYKNE